jgi:hypothetical protein
MMQQEDGLALFMTGWMRYWRSWMPAQEEFRNANADVRVWHIISRWNGLPTTNPW